MNGYVRSSPRFFRLIKGALLLGLLVLALLALLVPAPLQAPADLGRVPNPSKSAWFLLWMQELVSYSRNTVYLIALLGVGYAFLPWLPGTRTAQTAAWWPRDQRLLNGVTVAVFLAIILLTLVATFFRGPNWSFVFSF